GEDSGCLAVDELRVALVLLRPVDLGPAGAVDHRPGSLPSDHSLHPSRIRYIEVVVAESHHLMAHALGDAGDVPPEHPVGAGDEQLHGIAISALSPTRNRSVLGIPSLRVRVTLRPSRLASMRACRSRMLEPARTMECSISEPVTSTFASIAV